MMDISVIVPCYKGKKHIPQILAMINRNVEKLEEYSVKVELVLVNDFPQESIEIENEDTYNYNIEVINNKRNVGIHKSRCHGLKIAKGKYIVFLDQDDKISNDWLKRQYDKALSSDLVISNAIYHKKNISQKIYVNEEEMYGLLNKWALCKAGNRIVSPGQVLMRKDIIPRAWQKYNMENNGADDYFLWILLAERQLKIAYNFNLFYHHCYSQESVSHKRHIMKKSEQEMVRLINKYHLIPWIRRKIYTYRLVD